MITKQQITYIVALIGSIVFYISYQEWLSTLLLWVAIVLPYVSLLCSIPALRRARITVDCPTSVPMEEAATATLTCSEQLPFSGRLYVRRTVTDERWRGTKRLALPTAHCGALTVTPRFVLLYDRLGIIGFPAKVTGNRRTVVRPKELEMMLPSDIDRILSSSLRPKAGGGFSEVHELRPYRPGDSLSHMHWKLTAKLGEPILREPMQPDVRWLLMTDIGGTAEEMDRKLGRLLYMGNYLLFLGIPFETAAMTKEGLLKSKITIEGDLMLWMEQLLCAGPMTGDGIRAHTFAGLRRQYIGGEPA